MFNKLYNKACIIFMIIVCFICFISCEETGYDDPFISQIEGKWYINDKSEYIEFYPEDYIFEMNDFEIVGNFVINEKNPNEVLVIYDDPDGNSHSHYMRFHAYFGSNKSMYVDDAPMHEGERVLMFKPNN